MITRRSILGSLLTLTLSTGIIFATWFGSAWQRSRPLPVENVLGATTSQAQASLAPYPKLTSLRDAPNFGARHYVLYNSDSGKILLGEAADEEVAIASTTKLMTTLIAEYYAKPDDVVKVPRGAALQIGSLMGLFEGEEITVQNLLLGAMLVSGNDAAYALGYHVGGILLNDPQASEDSRVQRFIEEMNSTAAGLGMNQTHYQDPAGLNDTGRSTAHDIAKLMSRYIQRERLRTIISTAQATVTNVSGKTQHDLRNSNRLVADYLYEGVIGGKTGFTPDAGHCLASAATRNGITLIAVALNTYSTTKEASAVEVRRLLDYGFSQYSWY